MTSEPGTVLSPQGVERRKAMLLTLDSTMRRRNRTRVVRRAALAALVLAVVPAAVWMSTTGAPHAIPGVAATGAVSLSVTMIQTDPSVVDRLCAPTPAPLVRAISDVELCGLLRMQGLDGGFVRTRGRIMLSSEILPTAGEPNASDSSG